MWKTVATTDALKGDTSMQQKLPMIPSGPFSPSEREAVYRAIDTRRDVRGQFLPDPIRPEIMRRILLAAHHAPSVGFMQPWNFIIITEVGQKRRIRKAFEQANEEARQLFSNDLQPHYSTLKLEGISDAPVNLCVTCDRERGGPVVLGRTHNRDTDLYSTACAVQNLALAARAEGIGVGWVSIFKNDVLSELLELPKHVVPVAYLCLGHVAELHEGPELEARGWRKRIDLDELIFANSWGRKSAGQDEKTETEPLSGGSAG